MSIQYQRQTIGVEKKRGFLYVPVIGQKYMPATTGKFRVLLSGEKETRQLSYNADYKRVFGLTAWYKKNKIAAGSLLNIELDDDLMKVSVASAAPQPETEREETENAIDLSGLSSIAKGNIVEDRIKELVLLYGQGLLNVYKPVIDDRGIDLIVMRDGVFMPIFLQVKSRFNASKKESLLIEVGDNTFTAHHSYYILGASFNPATLELDDKLLLIPSADFELKATPIKDYNKKRVTVSLKKDAKGLWSEYLISKTTLVEALMDKFEEMAKYLK